jgi:DNA-binding MarR family transcriptional regulator
MSELGLSYKDQLIYIAVRSFYNSKDKYCYPSYITIAKRAGVSPKTVAASIKRLNAAKLIEVWKIGKTRHYHSYRFPEFENYLKISYGIFDIPNLTMFERSMLIMLFEYLDEDYKTALTISELEIASGETYKTIYTQLKSLQNKGYIAVKLKECDTDRTLIKVITISDRLKSQLPKKLEEVQIKTNQDSQIENILEMAMNLVRKGR